jgi:hypothetical protein
VKYSAGASRRPASTVALRGSASLRVRAARIGWPALDPSPVIPINSGELAQSELFLVIFTDPERAEFLTLIDPLSALGNVHGLQGIFVPQSVDRDAAQSISNKLRSSGWAVPFTYPRLSGTYTQSLLGETPSSAYALLLTAEGRVLYRSERSRLGAFEGIRAAIGE